MLRWWNLAYWRKRRALVLQRERLALLLWSFLSPRERSEDDAAPLWLLAKLVRAIEAGRQDFPEDETMQNLWDQARTDDNVQQAATDLRTLRLQMAGDSKAWSLPVAAFTRRQLKPLQARISADRLVEGSQWLHAPLTLPLLSGLFLFSGWMFNSIFFRHFGMPVGQYFGLSDYLAASIDGLAPAVIAITITVVAQWVIPNRIRLQTLQNRLGSWHNIGMGALVLLLVLPLATAAQGSRDSDEQRLVTIYMVLLGTAVPAIQLFISFSRRPARGTLLLTFSVIYLVVIWYTAELRYLRLDERTRLSEVTFAAMPDSPQQWRVISGNSLYLFLMDEQLELVAVPIEQVLSVRYPNVESGRAAEESAATVQ